MQFNNNLLSKNKSLFYHYLKALGTLFATPTKFITKLSKREIKINIAKESRLNFKFCLILNYSLIDFLKKI